MTTMTDKTFTEMRDELVLRAHEMTSTEFSVKRRRFIQAGGWWPNALSDWEKPEGRALALEIKARRGY